MKKKLVLKIGTSTLTGGTKLISRGKVEDIGRQILSLRDEYDIVLVSSGAIATAKQYINITDAGKLVESKQAMAAIGQPLLMRIYNEIFSDFGIRTLSDQGRKPHDTKRKSLVRGVCEQGISSGAEGS